MQIEVLQGFALPPTFPPFMVPERVSDFVKNTKAGMVKDQLVQMASDLALQSNWRHLPHLGEHTYDMGLTVDGLAVPLVAIMEMVDIH